jgi:hypothetical protein
MNTTDAGRRRHTLRPLAVLALLAVLAGCATVPRRPLLTLEQVITMAKNDVPAAQIIRAMDESRTVLALSGSQYAGLRQQGVPDEVLDHIQKRQLEAVEIDARFRHQQLYWGWGWGWGWPPPPAFPARPFPGRWPYWY